MDRQITDIRGAWALANGVEIPYLGLGVWQADNGQEVVDAIKWALQAGYRHIDTAAAYQNEAGVGRAIRESGVARARRLRDQQALEQRAGLRRDAAGL